MYGGFPVALVGLLRCPADSNELRLEVPTTTERIVDGSLVCRHCARTFPVRGGVVSLLPEAPLHPESENEMTRRDQKAEVIARSGGVDWHSDFTEATEVRPTLAALGPVAGKVIAELGCGTGRYTARLIRAGATVLAVDLSAASLRLLAARIDSSNNVGLLQADVTKLQLLPESVDAALSTLHSNLPDRDHRMAAVRMGAHALRDNGRYVVSMHYHGLRDLLTGVPAAGHYAENGIFRYHMRPDEARREMSPFFDRITIQKINANVPGLGWLGTMGGRLPLAREFARLMLAICQSPRREPTPGWISPASARCRAIVAGAAGRSRLR